MTFEHTFSGSPQEHIATHFCQVYFNFNIESQCFSYLNAAFSKLWGMEQAKVEKNTAILAIAIHPEDKEFLHVEYQNLIQNEVKKKIEFRLLLPDDTIRWISLAVYTYQAGPAKAKCVGGYAEDITKRKKYYDNILKFNTKKDSTLEILAHDLAAPFANIQGLVAALEQQIREGDLDVEQLLNFIRENAKTGSDMIRDFVDNEFMESSQVELNKNRIDIVEKITTVLNNYKQQEGLIGKVFTLSTDDKPIYLYLDEMKFMQVLNNLISNAIKFTDDYGLIMVTVEEKEGAVLISVADNGIGIPEHLQSFLFDKFTKARRPGIRGEKTTGLGMSIIKRIIEWHGGKIWFESKENEGSIFYMQVPI